MGRTLEQQQQGFIAVRVKWADKQMLLVWDEPEILENGGLTEWKYPRICISMQMKTQL